MISAENITSKIQKLPPASQKEVIDLIDSLLESRAEFTPSEKVAVWNEFVNGHASGRTTVEDSREGIYEDR